MSPDFRKNILYPHVTTKNIRVTVNFGKEVGNQILIRTYITNIVFSPLRHKHMYKSNNQYNYNII